MADNPLSQNLPADLPTNWQTNQIVSPNGASVGLTTQHGYNYLMTQGNASQTAINTIGAAFQNIFGKNETVPISNGGTGATTAEQARANLSVPALTDGLISTANLPTIPTSKGGTGSTTVSGARTNLSVYSKAETDTKLSTKLNTIGKGVNLLDNWYFIGGGSQQGAGQLPINTRGATTWTESWVYTIDRWKKIDIGAVTLDSTGLLVVNGETPHQILEKGMMDALYGQTLTFSLLFGNKLVSGSFVMPNTATELLIGDTDGVKLYLRGGGVNFYHIALQNNSGSTQTYKAAKLELGDTQTLARQENEQWVLNDPPPTYSAELERCKMSIADVGDWYCNFPFIHMASGSYVGTGTYGSSNPNILTFSFAPKFVWCADEMLKFNSNTATYSGMTYMPVIGTDSANPTVRGGFGMSSYLYAWKSLDGKTLSWYATQSPSGTDPQCNLSGKTYYYVAIG